MPDGLLDVEDAVMKLLSSLSYRSAQVRPGTAPCFVLHVRSTVLQMHEACSRCQKETVPALHGPSPKVFSKGGVLHVQ